MSRICDVTGRSSLKVRQVSHAKNYKIKHQQPNLHKKRFWVPSENRWVVLHVSAKGMREINKNGIETVLKKIGK
jgi:large subunit ribosomal protein L28